MGRTVRVPAEAQRIVSLAPNLTEIVFALGKGDSLYGDTDFCDFPAEATQKSHVGGPINPNMEQIVALRPDLILATKLINQRETVDALERLKLPVYVTDPHTVDEMVSSTERLGTLLHAEKTAIPLIANLRARLRRSRSASYGYHAPPRAFCGVDRSADLYWARYFFE